MYRERQRDRPDPGKRSEGDDVRVKVSPTVEVEEAESHQVAQVTEQNNRIKYQSSNRPAPMLHHCC